MSVILNSNNIMSLAEANKRAGYDRNEAFLRKLEQKHQILDVLPFYPASDGSFHRYNQATLLGKGKWRQINEGRETTRSTMETITCPVQLYSAQSDISEDVLELADNAVDARDSENLMNTEGMINDFVDSLINSDGSNDLAMKGFGFYRPKLGDYCLSAGAKTSDTTGKVTSMYLMEMGDQGVNIRFNPKLTGGAGGIGLRIKDEGKCWTKDPNNLDMAVYRTVFDLTAALEVRFNDALVRIANINTSKTFDPDLFIDAINLLHGRGTNAVAIAPRPVYAMLQKYAFNKMTSNFTVETFENFGLVVKCMGIPVLREDSIPVESISSSTIVTA